MKVLVTGSSGFLGQAIVAELSRNGIETIGLSRNAAQLKVDITDEKSFDSVQNLTNINAVIHSAGLAHQFGNTPENKFTVVNVTGTENVLKFAKRLQTKHFIHISSVAVYGESSKITRDNSMFQEDLLCKPIGIYAESKYDAEKIAQRFCKENDIKLTILRPATIIGEGDKGNLMRLIRQIKRKRFFWIGGGNNLKSLVSKDEVAKICYLMTQTEPFDSRIYNVTAEPLKMSEIVETIADELKVKISRLRVPSVVAKVSGRFSNIIKKWISDDVFSSEKLRSEFGIAIKNDIKETLRREVRSFED